MGKKPSDFFGRASALQTSPKNEVAHEIVARRSDAMAYKLLFTTKFARLIALGWHAKNGR